MRPGPDELDNPPKSPGFLAQVKRTWPALAMLPALVTVVPAVTVASRATLGRDQGIFQYVAWAVGQGDRAYRDVRDVNGPVVALVHWVFQALGGRDEHVFRVLDLSLTSLSFVVAGAAIPRIVATHGSAPAPGPWAVAAWTLLMAQYLGYDFWDTAQRESFLDWFMLASIALQARGGATFASGALSFVPWLGKPTYAIFTIAQLAGLERRELRRFLLGGAAGLVVPLLFLLTFGDLAAWARITFVDVPTMYRFIWPRPPLVILGLPWYRDLSLAAAATSVVLVGLVLVRWLPRRALPIALMPALGLVSVVVQAKGFPYHFHPVTLGTSYAWLVGIAVLYERGERGRRAGWVRVLALVLGGLAGVRATRLGWTSPYPVPTGDAVQDLAAFERVDFFPVALREAAAYLEAHTTSAERVQTYGMDPYLLFLARRRSATPYVYAYDLNADAALHGSFDPGGLVPSPAEAARIRQLRDAHVADLLARMKASPPAAFVFVDRSPLMNDRDAIADFATHCPEASAWVWRHYREKATFDVFHVWMRTEPE